jgi:hypothetical protein
LLSISLSHLCLHQQEREEQQEEEIGIRGKPRPPPSNLAEAAWAEAADMLSRNIPMTPVDVIERTVEQRYA